MKEELNMKLHRQLGVKENENIQVRYQGIESQSIESQSIERQSIERESIERQNTERQSRERKRIERQSIESESIERKRIERKSIEGSERGLGVRRQNNKRSAVEWLLILVTLTFLFLMLVMPLFVVMKEALVKGLQAYKEAILDPYTMKALQLTLQATVISVLINSIFGLFAAWTISKYHFKGKKLLITLIDIPFAISPIIAGLIFIMTFGRIGWAYELLQAIDLRIVFAVPGVILGTIFVTFPFISREVIPILTACGKDQEEAAALLGASAFTIFRRVTFPQMKWAFLYGIILCTARAMGEFGAVSVLSGHLRGKTNTLPLHVEILYSEFKFTSAFAVSSLLVVLAIIILVIRNIVEYKGRKVGGGPCT